MKRTVKVIVAICLLTTTVSSQTYLLRTVAVGTNNDSLYLKINGAGASTDSLFRNIAGSYVFAFTPSIKSYFPYQQLTNVPTNVSTALSSNNIKTVNGNSLVGVGDVSISGTAAWGSVSGTLSEQTDLQNALNAKQATLTNGSVSNSILANGAVANLTGTNSGDNAVNTTYANDYRAGNFIAGTNYLAPNGNGSALTGMTASQVGLGSVNNTSDASKPISTTTQIALDAKQATLVSATNIKTINGASVLGSGDLVVSGAANYDDDLLAYQALGSTLIAETVGQKLGYSNVSTAMVDNQIKFTAVYLPKAATVTGIKVYVRVLGAYTGDNNNRVGLYSYNAGVLTLVASSPNNSTLWTSAANSIQTVAFSTPYAASAGIYFAAFLFNNSAVTTAPSLASGISLNNAAMSSTAFGFTNSAKLYGTANGNDLTTPINMTAITASGIPSWVALY